jgi:hypothetical protein
MLLNQLFLRDGQFVAQQKILQRILVEDINGVQRFAVYFEIEPKVTRA